ncbi:hypothetical protein Srubr_57920 [Streptomyces rubradiris]|uniref:Uncharacterized protein n=1 Tax=Streptomyces rubradiris TaxID=285531 RepID=A0ABQ3RJB2_STRRR|nr:hypothetical protein GCM10018792_29770 [Streptomyces rubradiris]GHI55946.1 hypothetical protein Srubr_57920 [Streptomyces rubradiris]
MNEMYDPGSVTRSPPPDPAPAPDTDPDSAPDAAPATGPDTAASPAPRTVPPRTVLRLTCADDIRHSSTSPHAPYLLSGMTNSGRGYGVGERVGRTE